MGNKLETALYWAQPQLVPLLTCLPIMEFGLHLSTVSALSSEIPLSYS